MKRFYTVLGMLAIACMVSYAAPFYVEVNGKDFYKATPTGVEDYQGRTQYAAECVPLKNGDVLKCYDAEYDASWAIMVNDIGDTWGAKGFTVTANGLSCSVTGNYNVYIKMKYEDDCWYIDGPIDGCTPMKPTDPHKEDPTPGDGTSAPAKYPGVMLQAFYWDSYKTKNEATGASIHGRTKWIDLKDQAEEMGKWFDLVWLPPSAKSSGGTGYLPICYSTQDSDWGTKGNLQTIINTLHENGARVVADMVINHAASSVGWCTMAQESFGEFGIFKPDMSWICSTDEAFTGKHCTDTPGGSDDGYGSEANYEAGRDWDHNSAKVREMFCAYGKWMINAMGYDGFRYDYCKGFHSSHINEYNVASKAFFSVMEYWDGNPSTLIARLNDAGSNTTLFDFGVKYQALNEGIAAGNYGGCKSAGLLGRGKSRYSVTFVDSHDSYQRDGNEFMGLGNSMKNYDGKTLQANAYIICMPGTPCVFYPHWVTWKNEIKAMINARYKTGVHNESAVSDESGNGYYKATITGTNGEIRLLLGPNSGYASTPAGYTKAASGTNWGVYYKTNKPIGNKDENRQPINPQPEDIESVTIQTPMANKVIENGHLYIIVDGQRYDTMGRLVQ